MQTSQSPGVREARSRTRLRDLLLLIPEYDGRAHELAGFAAAVRHVARHLLPGGGPLAQRSLLLALRDKLRGQARAMIGHRLHRYADLEELLGSLHARFSGAGGEGRLLAELRAARQAEAEGLQEYGLRLDRLVTELGSIYEEDRWSEPEARRVNKEAVEEMAMASFRRGLRSAELEVRLAACELRTLEEAIQAAVVLENGLGWGEVASREPRASSYSGCEGKRRH